tara:strand:- start:264 stop:668 length:405 start_codon:yes stop_codon:yes gene_type:complete
MPCKDTTSKISILLDKKDCLIDFNYSKKTCNKEVGGGTGFREFCIGKSVDVLSGLEFDDLINLLELHDSENQFLLFLEWSSLGAALDQYQGKLVPMKEDQFQIATIAYESDRVEISQMVLAPSEMPKIIPCRKR